MYFSLIFVLLFHTQSSYFLGPDPLIFSEAEAYCVSQSSHLASVHSSAEFYEARSLCETVTNPEACWTGLERVGTSDVWTYTDGTALDFGFEASGSGVAIQGQQPPWITSGNPGPYGPQPDNLGNSESCVEFVGNSSHVFYDFYWNDRRCDHANYPICNGIMISTSDSYDSGDSDSSDDSFDFAAGNGDFMDFDDLNENENHDGTLHFEVNLSSYTWAHLWCAILLLVVCNATIWCVIMNRKCQS
eukprot:315226_1